MRPGTVDPSGFRHELVLHGSTAEMLEFVVPFVEDGVAAGEPTVLLVRPETAAVLLRTVGHSPLLAIQAPLGRPGREAADQRAADSLLRRHAAAG